jgi:uncharacterized protein (DUF2235 family)
MKRIVLCFDGTWNKLADENLPPADRVETNVARFHESVQDVGPDGTQQAKWYDQGVGTHWYDRYAGGLIGAGLEFNIVSGYRYLAEQHEDGDEVYVLGFSRGAYTARSLVGMIRNCGLIKRAHLANGLRVAMAYGIYRTRGDAVDSWTAKTFRAQFSKEIPIKFVGVWDTVGALGIPLDVAHEFNLKFYEFHDTRLSGIVENAYHAVAIDEHRQDYDVCLWDPTEKPDQTLEQRWFIGAHADVGGGYNDRHLSDLTLRWMQDRAAALGLALTPVEVGADAWRGAYANSYADFLAGRYALLHLPYFRRIGATQFGNEVVDASARQRAREDAAYRPQNPGF